MFDAIFPKHWTTLQRLMWLKTNALARAVYEIVTGNPVTFTAKAAPLRQLKVAFSPVQEGSGDPSPDNVRPISGWDSVNVYHSGADTSNPQTISISLGETVYSGYVDVVTGVLTVTRGKVTVNGDSNISNYSGWRFTVTVSDWTTHITSAPADLMCDKMKNVAKNAMPVQNAISGADYNSHKIMFSINNTITTVNAAKAWLSDNPLEIVYRLTTPLTIQLTPQEVESLAGGNTMWSDANGNLTVTYAADPATTPIVGKGKVGQAVIGG